MLEHLTLEHPKEPSYITLEHVVIATIIIFIYLFISIAIKKYFNKYLFTIFTNTFNQYF